MSVYALTAQGLYVFPDDNEDRYESNIRHSSMVAGHPVLCAGMIKVEDGVIVEIDNDSRHYQPNKKNFDAVVRFLESNQIDMQKMKLTYTDFETLQYR